MKQLFLRLLLLFIISCSDNYNVSVVEKDGRFGVLDGNFEEPVFVTLWPNQVAVIDKDSLIVSFHEDGTAVFHTERNFLPHSLDSAKMIAEAWRAYGYDGKPDSTSAILRWLGINNH